MPRMDDSSPMLAVIRDVDGLYYTGSTGFFSREAVWSKNLADAETFSSWHFSGYDTHFPSRADIALTIARKGCKCGKREDRPRVWVLNPGDPGGDWMPLA